MALVSIGGLVGCQAILGIDDTIFSPNGADDASAGDGSTTDGSITDGATSDAPSSDAAPGAILTFSPSRLFIHEGESVDVAVTLTRNGFAGAATLTLASVGDAGVTASGGPDASGASGIGVPALTIPAGSNTGTLHVTAGAAAPEGLTALDFTLAADKSSAVSLAALVGGAPGTLDTTFGSNGVLADVGGGAAWSVAIAPDDSIYAAGTFSGSWAVRHYFADSTADTTFNTAIATSLTSAAASGVVNKIAVHGTSLLVGGQDGSQELAIRKFSTAGARDSTFGSSGVFNLQKGAGGIYKGQTTGLGFSAAGDALATVTNQDLGTNFLFRFHPSAAEDQLAYGGTVIPCGVRLDATGAIVVGGAMQWPDGGANYFVQHVDNALGDAGTQVNGSPSLDVFTRNMVLSPDGQMVIAAVGEGNSPEGAFASFDSTSLAPGLLVNIAHGGTSDDGFDSVAAQPDAKLVFTGNAGGSMTNTFVRRYSSDGGLDTSFATNGQYTIAEMNFGPESHFYDVAVDSWGRIVVVGVNNATGVGFYVTRIWP